jgi:hypothetical protein
MKPSPSALFQRSAHGGSGVELSETMAAALGDGVDIRRTDSHLPGQSLDWMAGPSLRHNQQASLALSVPWCFAETEEERAEMVIHMHDNEAAKTGEHADGRWGRVGERIVAGVGARGLLVLPHGVPMGRGGGGGGCAVHREIAAGVVYSDHGRPHVNDPSLVPRSPCSAQGASGPTNTSTAMTLPDRISRLTSLPCSCLGHEAWALATQHAPKPSTGTATTMAAMVGEAAPNSATAPAGGMSIAAPTASGGKGGGGDDAPPSPGVRGADGGSTAGKPSAASLLKKRKSMAARSTAGGGRPRARSGGAAGGGGGGGIRAASGDLDEWDAAAAAASGAAGAAGGKTGDGPRAGPSRSRGSSGGPDGDGLRRTTSGRSRGSTGKGGGGGGAGGGFEDAIGLDNASATGDDDGSLRRGGRGGRGRGRLDLQDDDGYTMAGHDDAFGGQEEDEEEEVSAGGWVDGWGRGGRRLHLRSGCVRIVSPPRSWRT